MKPTWCICFLWLLSLRSWLVLANPLSTSSPEPSSSSQRNDQTTTSANTATSTITTTKTTNTTITATVSGSGDQDTESGNSITPPATYITSTSTTPPLTKCRYELLQGVRNEMFSVHKKNLPLNTKIFSMGVSQTRCYMTRRDLENTLNPSSLEEVIVVYALTCLNPAGTDILFFEDEEVEDLDTASVETIAANESVSSSSAKNGQGQDPVTSYRWYGHVISYFQTSNCRIGLKMVDIVANMTDLRVLSIYGHRAWDLGELVQQPELCRAFRSVVAFSLLGDWSGPGYLHHLAICAGQLDNVVEMVITNNSLTSFPEVLKPAVPNLRALEMSVNNLTAPVDFPWPYGFARLPRNLTRTYQFNIQYNFRGSFDMQPNLFRRVYMLNANKITNLTHFQFFSDFQFISLERNGMRVIGENVFDLVPGLQYLSLANNELEVLPPKLFAMLTNLKRLDLQGNKLKLLPTDIFRNMGALERLNLEQNQLQVLQDGLFTSLEELTNLHLKNNSISEVRDGAFTTLSVKLKTLDLQFNPLKSFPVIVLVMRGLTTIYLQSTDIEVLDFVEINRRITLSILAGSLKNPTSGEFVDMKDKPSFQRNVHLEYSKLRSVVVYNATRETVQVFMLVLKYFNFHVEGANLACDCHILNATHEMKNLRDRGLLTGEEPCFNGWVCAWPTELAGTSLSRLRDEDTYCPLAKNDSASCPQGCSCYLRTRIETVIVDCQHAGLSAMPMTVPPNTRELWLQNNSIKVLDSLPYLSYLHSLRLTSNNVQELPIDVLLGMAELSELHVDDNWLTGLHHDFAALTQLQAVRLAGNPFRCDCTTLWMKQWLLSHQMETADWAAIKCTTEDDDGQLFTAVPDSRFVCTVSASLGQLAVPVAIPLAFAFIFLTLAVVAFIHRRRLKVLLYIHTGYHPFDRDPPDEKALYDVTVCCDVNARAWVLRHVIEALEEDGRYKVFFYSRDAYLGFTTSENVRHCVQKSRRMVIVLGKGWEQNDLLVTCTREALARCRKDMPHFMTVLVHQLSAKDIDNKDLQQYVHKGRYIVTEDKHFTKKLLYEMPHVKSNKPAADTEKGPRPKHPEPVALYDIVAAAENEQNDAVEQNRDRPQREVGFVRQISENFGGGDAFILPRQDSYHPSIDDAGHNCAEHVDEMNLRNRAANNENNEDVDRNMEGNPVTYDKMLLQPQVSVDSVAAPHGRVLFVWYADADLAYTCKHLVEPLEKRGHSCILQDRDFPLGAAIQETIVHAVERSTRCVFVLSNDTAVNDWFNFAFHVAFDRHLQLPDHRVALVTRDGVDVSRFADEVQQALNTSSVLTEDDPWFWKKIKTFLSFDKKDLC